MKIYSFPDNFNFIKPVVTVGTFDGVHNGHREVIRHVKNVAAECGGESVVVTLWPHPRIALEKTDNNFFLLNTREEKIHLFTQLGIDHLVIIPFTKEFSKISSAEFISKILVDAVRVSHLIVGPNNHYGFNREGDFHSINQYASAHGFSVIQPEIIYVDKAKVSSTEIRNIILQGELEIAATYLGYHYLLSGKVIPGDKIGQTIGFPTANISIDEKFKLIPPDGVYAVKVINNCKEYGGMMYIGNRPTLKKDEKKKNIEIHLFNFTGDLYGLKITVNIISRIRGDIKFENLEALHDQIVKDKDSILKLLKKQI